jgi:hypothetical protein
VGGDFRGGNKYAGLAVAGQFLAEIEELADGSVWVIVLALLGGFGAENVGDECCVSDLLVRHELDQETVFGG